MAVSTTLVVVVGVISARDHVARRRAIRETWGSHDTSAMRVTFVLGCDSTDCVERYDEATSELTVTHREAYSRVVDKFFAFVRFAMARWSFSFLCKADDDSFFVVPDFLNVLRTEAPARRHYRGNIWTGSPVRAAEHKNRLAPACYPLAQLPPFAWGGCWLVSSDVAAVLGALASPSLAALDGGIWQRDCRGNVEDVQLGLLMLALGVVPTHDSRFAPAIRCHRRSLVLLDVPDSAALTRTLWAQCAAAPNASASAARCCTRALHTANARLPPLVCPQRTRACPKCLPSRLPLRMTFPTISRPWLSHACGSAISHGLATRWRLPRMWQQRPGLTPHRPWKTWRSLRRGYALRVVERPPREKHGWTICRDFATSPHCSISNVSSTTRFGGRSSASRSPPGPA